MSNCLNKPSGGRRAHQSATARLLVGIGLIAIVFLTVVLIQTWHWTHEHIDRTVARQAQLAIEFDKAIRAYVQDHIRPEMAKRVETGEFIPETMSTSFVSRRIFEGVHKSLPESILRFPSTNPRNPINLATSEEEAIIRYFEEHPEATSWAGTMVYGKRGEKYFVRAAPRRFTEQCLECHGRPEDAPKALLERYGSTAGFGRSPGEVSVELVALPVDAYYAEANARLTRHMFAAVLVCLLFVACIAVLIVLDVKARNQSQKALASIVEGLPIPAFVIDAEHRVSHWNRALEIMTDIPAEDVIGTSDHWRVVYDSPRPCLADLLLDGATDGIPDWYDGGCHQSALLDGAFEGTYFFETLGNGGRWLHFTAAAVYGADGRMIGAIETFQDITERKQATDAIRHALAEAEQARRKAVRMAADAEAARAQASEQSARIQAMITGMKEGVVFADTDGIVVEVNAFFCDFLERDRSQILGRSLVELHEGEIRDRVMQAVEMFRTRKLLKPLEVHRQLKQSHVMMRMQPVYNGDAYCGVLLNVIDVSELVIARCQAEAAKQEAMATSEMLMEETRRSRELALQAQAACVSKTEFLANISHEIRTPMTAILGFAETLLDTPDADFVSADRRDAIETIRRNGEHLLELINDILDLSKIEVGKLELETALCAPADLLAEVRALMWLRAEEKHLPLIIEYDGPVPEWIHTDPLRLRQILINLVGNAIKFTERGSVRIVAKLVDETAESPRLRFDVIDTGIGIAEDHISRLFEPFTQADSSTTREFGGTGLGLTISKRLAGMLGGDIAITSSLGKGSTFSLTIATGSLEGTALLDSPVESGMLDQQITPGGNDKKANEGLDCRILLAEDGLDNQRLIAMLLEKAGAQVVVVNNGQSAVDEILAAQQRECPFDVVLMDMQMPIMDGYLATRSLRERGYTGPIIALTAHAMTEDRQRCLDAGCDDYAAKPIDRAHLLAVVARHAQAADACV